MIEFQKVQAGDILAFVTYVKVDRKKENWQTFGSDGEIHCLDLTHGLRDIQVKGKDLIEKMDSADKFDKEERLTRTEVVEKFVNSGYRPFTVAFIKADGQRRVLRGRLLDSENLLGRSCVEDLDVVGGYRMRQVDHRTIEYVIVGGTKYSVR